jgi:hypothetical protein
LLDNSALSKEVRVTAAVACGNSSFGLLLFLLDEVATSVAVALSGASLVLQQEKR